MARIFDTTFDDTNFPTRRAVERHWDQTIDGLGDADVGQTGDGISGNGGWTTANGAGDQILGAANYSGGGGGKGFRHWVGNGLNDTGGSIKCQWTPVTEMWLRCYIRFQAGFAWGSSINMKNFYNTGSGTFYFGLHDGVFGGHVQNDPLTRNGDAAGNLHTSITWADWQGGSTGDGQFHCIELHAKMNTGGGQNGIFECWLDNVLAGSWSDVRFEAGAGSFGYVLVGENHNDPQSGSSADQYVDFDDLAVDNSARIGPLSAGPAVGDVIFSM